MIVWSSLFSLDSLDFCASARSHQHKRKSSHRFRSRGSAREKKPATNVAIATYNIDNINNDIIKNNIYNENTKQIGIKLIPHQEKKDCQN